MSRRGDDGDGAIIAVVLIVLASIAAAVFMFRVLWWEVLVPLAAALSSVR